MIVTLIEPNYGLQLYNVLIDDIAMNHAISVSKISVNKYC